MSVIEKYSLEDRRVAIKNIHFPKNMKELSTARKRLVFDEFFEFINTLRNLKDNNKNEKNEYILEEPDKVKNLIKNLPYNLTSAQLRTWEEIKKDISSPKVMNRLIQGDVGSGKTIVAFLALITAALNGYQGALMAPTEVLARQHFEQLKETSEKNNIDLCPVILVGSMTAKEKRMV